MKKIHRNSLIAGKMILSLLFALALFLQCSGEKNEGTTKTIAVKAEDEDKHDHADEEIVKMGPGELKEFGIELAEAGPGKLEMHIDLTGEIVIDPDRLAHIVPRFPGIVREVRKKIGDKVHKEEVLAIIESNESLVPYEVKSLIDGTVIDMHLTNGEMVTHAGHAFTIADLSKVWANLSVYQKDLPYIRIGQKAYISAGPQLPEVVGKISYISPVVDEETRTATARVVLSNPTGLWRPGLFVNAKVIIEALKISIIAPKTALQLYENNTVVFVKTKEGFVPRPIKVGRSNIKFVEITSGLNAGQVYVAKGGFTLKAELQKKSFGEGHEH